MHAGMLILRDFEHVEAQMAEVTIDASFLIRLLLRDGWVFNRVQVSKMELVLLQTGTAVFMSYLKYFPGFNGITSTP